MKRLTLIIIVAIAMIPAFSSMSRAESMSLLQRSCSELISMAQSFQDDEKIVNTVLGSAIDAGTLDRVKKYKLKRAEVKKKLGRIMKAIEIKGCIEP
jgi:hypothetical protein